MLLTLLPFLLVLLSFGCHRLFRFLKSLLMVSFDLVLRLLLFTALWWRVKWQTDTFYLFVALLLQPQHNYALSLNANECPMQAIHISVAASGKALSIGRPQIRQYVSMLPYVETGMVIGPYLYILYYRTDIKWTLGTFIATTRFLR